MTNLYNDQYSKDALALINEAAQVALSNSLAMWEQQIDYVKKNADRNLSRAVSLQQAHSPEEVLNLQRKAGEAEFAELKKTGEACYALANSAGQEYLSVAKKGRALFETSFADVTEKASSVLPNGKAALFSDMLQNSVKTASDLFQNGFDAAVQAARTGADTVAKSQQVVAKAQVVNGKGKGKARK